MCLHGHCHTNQDRVQSCLVPAQQAKLTAAGAHQDTAASGGGGSIKLAGAAGAAVCQLRAAKLGQAHALQDTPETVVSAHPFQRGGRRGRLTPVGGPCSHAQLITPRLQKLCHHCSACSWAVPIEHTQGRCSRSDWARAGRTSSPCGTAHWCLPRSSSHTCGSRSMHSPLSSQSSLGSRTAGRGQAGKQRCHTVHIAVWVLTGRPGSFGWSGRWHGWIVAGALPVHTPVYREW